MNPSEIRGLSTQEVLRSRADHGDNVITPQAEESAWRLLAEKFRDPLIRILIVAAALSLAIAVVERDFTEPVGILCAIVLATGVGFWFEWDARCRFRRLNRVNDEVPVKVLRDGAVGEIPRREVVVGDIVYVESGETVPADGEIVEAVSLKIDESTLTGEPEVDKTADPAHFDPEATYPSNILLRGTRVADGYGAMRTTAVGDRTEAGRVTEQATVRNDDPTPLDSQLERLSKWIGRAGIGLAAAIFCTMLAKALLVEGLAELPWLDAAQRILHIFMVSVAIIVMAVPEGLPMAITLSLAMSMRRMLRTNNLVRRMHACETMGAVTVICTDKTGTLTRNRMRTEELVRYDDGMSLRELAETIAANSTAHLDAEGGIIGNPTEGALLAYLREKGEAYETLRAGARIIDRMTFSTERKYMATLVRSGVTGRRLLCVKGAPEIVRAMCIPDGREEEVAATLAGYQRRAMRTLALAWAETEAADCAGAIADGGLRFAAVAAIADPVRDDVPEAVGRCLGAGISIKIVTGDTEATACEIARRIGLWGDADGARNRMTGTEFAAATDEELLDRVADLKILSRARPLDKQRLVRLLQRRGEVVAVTGDGTNDAPALNFANVGLSMGSGTSVAKDASAITLLDDSFASIATAVLWGRSLYRNIQRFVLFQLTVNLAAILVCLVGALAGSEMPLTVVQILWVNIIMDTFAAMAMASLPPRGEVMGERPRRRDAFIVTPDMARTIFTCGLAMAAVLLAMLFRWSGDAEGLTLRRLTIFFTTFVFMQFWNMFNAKGFEARRSLFASPRGCREFFLILALIAAGQWAIVTFGGEVFRTEPLAWREWAWIVGGTSLMAIGGEVVRALRRRTAKVLTAIAALVLLTASAGAQTTDSTTLSQLPPPTGLHRTR